MILFDLCNIICYTQHHDLDFYLQMNKMIVIEELQLLGNFVTL